MRQTLIRLSKIISATKVKLMDADRITPVTRKIDSDAFRALFTPELNKLTALFTNRKYEIRIAGGAVRDLLLERIPHDIDLATTATPTQMIDMFNEEKVRILHKAGEKHGTVACRIDDKENFEVTTLRIDLVCDGRRAEIAFTEEWQLDANRRDLTVNSMFLDFDGTVFDYFGGMEDLKARRVRFVGEARQRIMEDYLRILRYFRFFGRIADETSKMDQETLEIITSNRSGLSAISGERLWTELRQILTGRHAALITRTLLHECKCGDLMGLPSDIDVERLEKIYGRLKGELGYEACTLLASVLDSSQQLDVLHKRLRLSNVELHLAQFIIAHRDELDSLSLEDALPKYKLLILDQVFDKSDRYLEKVIELAKYCGHSLLIPTLSSWEVPEFPVNGLQLGIAGVKKGPRVKHTLQHLYNTWKSSDCKLNSEHLLEHVNDKEIDAIEAAFLAGKKSKKRKMSS